MTDLSAKFAALESSLTTQLGLIYSAQQANVTGLTAVAAALQAIGACLCEDIAASIPGVGLPLNDPPADLCDAYERVERVQSWQLQGEATVNGVACKLWAPLFPYQAGLQGWRTHILNESGRRAHIVNMPDNHIFWCMVWNFTGSTAPLVVYRDLRTGNLPDDYNLYSSLANSQSAFPIPDSNQLIRSYAEDKPAVQVNPGEDPITFGLQYIFAYPATETSPPYNAFLRYPAAG